MTDYFVSPNGSNANNGLGPDASDPTNKPWLTVGKALNTGSAISAAGGANRLYLAPGTFPSEALVPIAAITSVANPLTIQGDPSNSKGFKDGSGVLRPPKEVWVAVNTGDDVDSASANVFNGVTNNPLGLIINDVNFSGAFTLTMAGNTSLVVNDCTFVNTAAPLQATSGTPTAGRVWRFNRCVFMGNTGGILFESNVAAATANADLDIILDACIGYGVGVRLGFGTTAGNKAGGVRVRGCLFVGPQSAVADNNAAFEMYVSGSHSTVVTSDMTGCTVIGAVRMFHSADASCLVDGGSNYGIGIRSANTNVTAAGTTKVNVVPYLILPGALKHQTALALNELFGWTDDAPAARTAAGWTGSTTPDFRGRTARPWGAASSVGPFETGHVAQDTGSAITGGGANSLKITGAGEVSLFVPVAAAATTITVVTKGTSYGGASYPKVTMEANPSAGVAATTSTATSAAEQTLTIGPFSPTVGSVVELRLRSDSSSVSSSTFFDLLAAS